MVDDEPQLVRLVTRYLERLGYQVVSTGSTEEAWGLVELEPLGFFLAIIDVSMENPTGEELAWRILSARPQAYVILSSGYAADLGNIEHAYPGRVSFLQKPFSGEMLAQAVERIAESRGGTSGAAP